MRRKKTMSEHNLNDQVVGVEVEDLQNGHDYDTYAKAMCDKVSAHVNDCQRCQRRLSFDPIEKALLKSHSIKNECFELIAFIAVGIFIIILLQGKQIFTSR